MTSNMMTAAIFAKYALTIFSSPHQANTDAMVWWYATRNVTVQSDALNRICVQPDYSVKDIVNTFWNINSTLFVTPNLQNQMIRCVDSISKGEWTSTYISNNPNTARAIFWWNPYTPKSISWFKSVAEINQKSAIDFICRYSKFPADFLDLSMKFLRQEGRVQYSSWIESAMDRCVSIAYFTASPTSNQSLSWFIQQPYQIQKNAAISLCASKLNTTDLKTIFRTINQTNSTAILTDGNDCVRVRELDPINTYKYFDALSTTTLMWLASRNLTLQKDAIMNICLGRSQKRDNASGFFKAYNISEIASIFDSYTSFLNETNLLTKGIETVMKGCPEFYASSTMDTWINNASQLQSMVWVASQNSSTQVEFFSRLCQRPGFNATTEFYGYGLYVSLEWSSQAAMMNCPNVWVGQAAIVRSESNVFFGLSGVAGFFFLVFVTLLVYELRVIKTKESSVSRVFSPFNISLSICFLSNLIGNFSFGTVWYFGLVGFITGINHSMDQMWFYLISESANVVWSLSYLYYCWSRSETILSQVWPRTFQYIRSLFLVSPLFIGSPLVSHGIIMAASKTVNVEDVFNSSIYTYLLQAVSATVLLLFDLLLLITFTRFIAGLQTDMDSHISSTRFSIISRHGIAASVFCVGYSALSILKPILTITNRNNVIYLKIALTILIHCVTLVLLLMKIALLRDSSEVVGQGGTGGTGSMARAVKSKTSSQIGTSTGKKSAIYS
ncbi:hypothetical protein BDR26DRAFT_858870 [Obelidium mucronatum]|nr:hypothetical protein BDR26DRAFT_858870 [Obelidium mucronatum]